jgi:hypothetical protein
MPRNSHSCGCANWKLEDIRKHRGLNEQQAKGDELENKTYNQLKTSHVIPMVNMGIKAHPHNEGSGISAYMKEDENLEGYRQCIKDALGWIDHPKGTIPVTGPDRKRRDEELLAYLADLDALEDVHQDGEEGEDSKEQPKKKGKIQRWLTYKYY